MPTQKELVKAARAKKLAGGSDGKPCKSATFSKSAHVPRASHAPCKGGGERAPPTSGIKKPKRHKPGIVACMRSVYFKNLLTC